VRGVKVSVGGPFFNRMTVPICAALLFLVGVGPVLPWRGMSREELKRRLLLPGIFMLFGAAIAVTVGARKPYAVLAFAFSGFALAGNVGEFVRGTRARQRANGESALVALWRLVRANNRRYGGYLAHIGVVIVALGIAASSTFSTEREATLRPGQTMNVGEFTVRFDELRAFEEPHRLVVEALVSVQKGGRTLGQMNPRMNYYRTRDESVPTPAVRSRLTRDFYINLMAFERTGAHATFTVFIRPLVAWIWAGGVVVALGGLFGVLPLQPRKPLVLPRRREKLVAA
jgi:cytochrome c-type biogenesis protein CcmF